MTTQKSEISGKYTWCADLYGEFGESTHSGTVDGACGFPREMLPALERVVEHLDMTKELTQVLSTSAVSVEYRIETDVSVGQAGYLSIAPLRLREVSEPVTACNQESGWLQSFQDTQNTNSLTPYSTAANISTATKTINQATK